MVVGGNSKGLTLQNAPAWRTMPSAERRAPSAERRAPSAERRAPSAERRAPSAERRAPSAERRAPSAERRAPSAERRAPLPLADLLPPRRGGRPSPDTASAARPAGLAPLRLVAIRSDGDEDLRVLPSAEAMIAPRAREQHHPASPPDRLPPRRGGRPSSKTESAAGRPADLARPRVARRPLLRSRPALAAAALLAALGALALPATAEAQNCTLNTGDVWCGVVTVGAETTGGATTGHGFSSITGNSFGTLTDNSGDQTFTYGTQTYVVSRVVVGAGSFAGELAFRVQRGSPEALRPGR